jgi:hypothetical protein
MLAPEFTRAGLVDALRKRHHYATTGSRVGLRTRVTFPEPARRFANDPNLGATTSEIATTAMMGDIVSTDAAEVTFEINVVGTSPIERIEIWNALERIETFRPFATVGNRLRVIWEGAEYRGRGRESNWDGQAELTGNTWSNVTPINRYNIDKVLEMKNPRTVEWTATTTGGFGGFEARLADATAGTLTIATKHVNTTVDLAKIGAEDTVFEAGGLRRRMRLFRLPEDNPHRQVTLQRTIPLADDRDNALYVRITFEDGHIAWSSPMYIFHHKNF